MILRFAKAIIPCLLTFTPLAATAQEICESLLQFGIYDQVDNYTDSQRFNLAKHVFCSEEFATEESARASASGIGIDVVDILGANFSSADSGATYSEKRSALCSLDYAETKSSDSIISSVRAVSKDLVLGFNDCIQRMSQLNGLHGFVTVAANRDQFNVQLSFNDDGTNTYFLEEISSGNAKIECTNGEHSATKDDPIELSGVEIVSCINKTPNKSFILKVQTNVGVITGPGTAGITIIGADAILLDINERLKFVEANLVPAETLAYFANNCPRGWIFFPELVGRYAVGTTPDSGTSGVAVGTALQSGEVRATGMHSHSYSFNALVDRSIVGGVVASNPSNKAIAGLPGSWTDVGNPINLVEIHSNVGSSGTSDISAPYLQLIPCKKS